MEEKKEQIDLSPIQNAVCTGCNPTLGKDVLRLLDLSPQDLRHVLDVALEQKEAARIHSSVDFAQGKAVAIIMEKPSLRTRVSFEVAVSRLGAHPVVLADKNSAFSRGESIQDTTLVLERFVDCIVLRTFDQVKLEEVADWASVPVINALSDDFHPCQGLADALTILEHKGKLSGLKLAYVGDGSNNMAHTYLELAALAGMDVTIAAPAQFQPKEWVFEECQVLAQETGAKLKLVEDPKEALSQADIVITDTWTSMGDEEEHDERLRIFNDYQVNSAAMKLAKDDAIFMHCLPAHRGEEVTDAVMDSDQSVIYDEAENRLHAQQALLSIILGGK